jgi:site-specific recombinase XerD
MPPPRRSTSPFGSIGTSSPKRANTDAFRPPPRPDAWSAKGATDILAAIAADAGIPNDFSPHVRRHCFGTTLVRDGHDLVLVAELMGHARLETTRAYALPTATDRQRAIDSLPTDR